MYTPLYNDLPDTIQQWLACYRHVRINYIKYNFQPCLSGPVYVPAQSNDHTNANYMFGSVGSLVQRDQVTLELANNQAESYFSNWNDAVQRPGFKFHHPAKPFKVKWTPQFQTLAQQTNGGLYNVSYAISKGGAWLDQSRLVSYNGYLGALYLCCNQPNSTTSFNEYSGQIYQVVCTYSISVKNRLT